MDWSILWIIGGVIFFLILVVGMIIFTWNNARRFDKALDNLSGEGSWDDDQTKK